MKQPKSAVFKAEQDQLRKDLLEILNLHTYPLNADVKTITLHELDKVEKQEAVMNLLPSIKKYFTITNKALIYPNETKRPHLTIVRFLLKENYQIVGKYVEESGLKTTRYYFYPLKSET